MKRNKIASTILALVLSLSMVVSAYGTTAPAYSNATITSTSIKVDNQFITTTTTHGTITVVKSGFTEGDTITMKLGTAELGKVVIDKSDSATSASIDVTTLTKKKGKISVQVTALSTATSISKAVNIDYLAQKSPVVTATAITVTQYADQDVVLTVTGLSADDVVNVYDVTDTKVVTAAAIAPAKDPAAVKAKGKGTASIKLAKMNVTSTGGIYVSVINKECSESDKVLATAAAGANYVLAETTPGITTTSAIAVKGGLLVSGLVTTGKQKYTIDVYSADPTANLAKNPTAANKTALKAILLGSKSVGVKNTYVFIPFKTELADTATKVYVTSKFTGEDKTKGKLISKVVELTVK